MNVLGIETSCDDTAAAVVANGRRILSSVVSSQAKLHRRYGGVVPELASRAHLEMMAPVVREALREGRVTFDEIDAIAVTVGPGLVGALLVGLGTARALGYSLGVPLVGVNHLEAHLFANCMGARRPLVPAAALVVSGGHTELVEVRSSGLYRHLGRTRDDAVGEAFDKVSKMLGLGYPGGPVIDRLARQGDAARFPLPRPRLRGSWDFSFSGLKTAVLYGVTGTSGGRQVPARDVAAGFEAAAVEVLVEKLMLAAGKIDARAVWLGGGVAANSLLRAETLREARKRGLGVSIPSLSLCMDNAAIVAALGGAMLKAGMESPAGDVDPGLELEKEGRLPLRSAHRHGVH